MSRSNYYRKSSRTVTTEEKEAEEAVIRCFKHNKGNYGRIRIRKSLLKQGIDISEYRIARILKTNGLQAKTGRTENRKTKISEEQYIEENLVKDKFAITVPNYLWSSDITELRCKSGKFYVSGILDVATRRVIGWSIQKRQTQEIAQQAFQMAIGRNKGQIPEGAIFHSDRGCQYTAKKTKELVETNGFRKSMSRPGTPSDNQPIESFWRTLGNEMPDISGMKFEEASRTVVEYIELYYNSDRLHSGIGYQIPNEFFTILCVLNS